MKIKIHTLLFLGAWCVVLGTFFSSCIRLTGSAGYWKQNENDEAPQGKQIGFDSDDLVYPNRAKGDITL